MILFDFIRNIILINIIYSLKKILPKIFKIIGLQFSLVIWIIALIKGRYKAKKTLSTFVDF